MSHLKPVMLVLYMFCKQKKVKHADELETDLPTDNQHFSTVIDDQMETNQLSTLITTYIF